MFKFGVLLFVSLLLVGCIQGDSKDPTASQENTQAFSAPIPLCNKIPLDGSVFVSVKPIPFFEVDFLIGEDYFHAQPSISWSTHYLEIGVQDEFPLGKTQPDFLYLVILNTNEIPEKQKRIYCFDLNGESVEIIPARQDLLPLRIIVSPNDIKVFQEESELVRYQTIDGRHILTIDASSSYWEIKPLTTLPERLVKPNPQFKYCHESITNRKISSVLVCPSDALEFILGFFPRLIGRFHPALGSLALLLGEGSLFIMAIRKAWNQKDFLIGFFLILFAAWLVLVATNTWPYALLYP